MDVHVLVGYILSLTSPLVSFLFIPLSPSLSSLSSSPPLLPSSPSSLSSLTSPPPSPPSPPPFYPVWGQPSQGGGEFVVCFVYVASEHSCHTELPCTPHLCLWQCGSNVAPGKASDGVLQSEADSHHRHRTDEGLAGGSWRGGGGGMRCMYVSVTGYFTMGTVMQNYSATIPFSFAPPLSLLCPSLPSSLPPHRHLSLVVSGNDLSRGTDTRRTSLPPSHTLTVQDWRSRSYCSWERCWAGVGRGMETLCSHARGPGSSPSTSP